MVLADSLSVIGGKLFDRYIHHWSRLGRLVVGHRRQIVWPLYSPLESQAAAQGFDLLHLWRMPAQTITHWHLLCMALLELDHKMRKWYSFRCPELFVWSRLCQNKIHSRWITVPLCILFWQKKWTLKMVIRLYSEWPLIRMANGPNYIVVFVRLRTRGPGVSYP